MHKLIKITEVTMPAIRTTTNTNFNITVERQIFQPRIKSSISFHVNIRIRAAYRSLI